MIYPTCKSYQKEMREKLEGSAKGNIRSYKTNQFYRHSLMEHKKTDKKYWYVKGTYLERILDILKPLNLEMSLSLIL